MLKQYLTALRKQRIVGADKALSQLANGWNVGSQTYLTSLRLLVRAPSTENTSSATSRRLQTLSRDTPTTATKSMLTPNGKYLYCTTPNIIPIIPDLVSVNEQWLNLLFEFQKLIAL